MVKLRRADSNFENWELPTRNMVKKLRDRQTQAMHGERLWGDSASLARVRSFYEDLPLLFGTDECRYLPNDAIVPVFVTRGAYWEKLSETVRWCMER
jgi:hypothetical protein